MELEKITGPRVRMLRLEKQLLQEQLGQAVSVTKATISRVESGDRAASIELLIRLADFFEVPIDFLLGNPPFDQWELVMEHREEITEAIASELSFLAPGLADRLRSASLPQFISFVGALLSRILFDPETGALTLVYRLSPQ